MVFTLSPLTVDMASLVMPMVACTWDMEDSKLAAVATAAVPRPTTGAVTDLVSVSPTPDTLSPTAWSLSPTCPIF